MKSLEIVNNLINYMESVGETYDFTNISKEDCKKIKQDLEVLEIIRKKKVDINLLLVMLGNSPIEEALENYNACGYRKLTMEELLKLKQWLEENYDEN